MRLSGLSEFDTLEQLRQVAAVFGATEVHWLVDPRFAAAMAKADAADPTLSSSSASTGVSADGSAEGSEGGVAVLTFDSVSSAKRFVEGRDNGPPGVFVLEGRDLPVDYYHAPIVAAGGALSNSGARHESQTKFQIL